MLLAAEAERDRLTGAVAELEQEAEVLQLLLDTLDTAESEAKARYLAPVVSRVEPYLKMLLLGSDIKRSAGRSVLQPSSPATCMARAGSSMTCRRR